jgi:ATP-dependent Clp protease ATP-binding subunit ClpA
MPRRLTTDARRSLLEWAVEEARARGDRRTGTDHLLIALLRNPDGIAERALGVSADDVRATRDRLDLAALGAVGVEIAALVPPVPVGGGGGRLALTSGALDVLRAAIEVARAQGARRVESRHLLLGILSRRPPDPAADLLTALGVDVAAARTAASAPPDADADA